MNTEEILALSRSYQPAAVLAAAAELDMFTALGAARLDAETVAGTLQTDLRGTRDLLDALAALGLLHKNDAGYSVPETVAGALVDGSPGNVLSMVRHHGNCLRRWARLAESVQDGNPVERESSLRGEEADHQSFIEAMNDVSARVADEVVRDLPPAAFCHLLDVGGASGTWTIAFLRRRPSARATLFDLPAVIPMAEKRLGEGGWLSRVALVAGDYRTDPLPGGADLAWVSAIAHQNSREENRRLYGRVFEALLPGGRILIRDLVMEPGRTAPQAGALFALNMLVNTRGGGTYTLADTREDLQTAGFRDVEVVRPDPGMNSVIAAARP